MILSRKNGVGTNEHKIKRHDKVVTMLIITFFMLPILSNYWVFFTATVFTYLGFIIAVIAGLISLNYNPQAQNKSITEALFYSVVSVLYLLSILYNGNSEFSYMLWNLKYALIAVALTRTKIWIQPARIAFWTMGLFLIVQMRTGINIRLLTLVVTRNAISIHLMVFCIIYIIALKEKYIQRCWVPALVSLYITIWTGSRSGIIAFSVMLIGLLVISFKSNIKKKKPLRKKIIIGTIFLAVTGTLVYSIIITNQVDYYLGMLTEKKNSTLAEDVRFIMIADYLKECTSGIGNFIFGASFDSIPSISYYSGNPHNSYVHAYGNYGLIFLLIVLYRTIRALVYYWKKRNIFFILLIALSLRAFGDIAGFYGIFDPFFYYFIFEFFISGKPKFLKTYSGSV